MLESSEREGGYDFISNVIVDVNVIVRTEILKSSHSYTNIDDAASAFLCKGSEYNE